MSEPLQHPSQKAFTWINLFAFCQVQKANTCLNICVEQFYAHSMLIVSVIEDD